MSKQWLTATINHDGGLTERFVHTPETAETHTGMLRRMREVGRDFTSGLDWIEYESSHSAMGETWRSWTRLVWSDAEPQR
ncbi:hypothetical protein [Micromonospora sp. NPDC050695]|uniref:hypothetical protein n=1 Tax=Micromonospora sp. NPDC050695 TaxID=3154938 RepID=UPI0033D31E21